MNSKSKNPKVTTTSEGDFGDRLSNLPDSIINLILSYLPTKYAAATSLLSSRWRYTFLSVPNIDLDDSLLLLNQGKQGNNENVGESPQSFIDFVDRLVMLGDLSRARELPSVSDFRLKCRKIASNFVLNSWIYAMIWRNIQVLDIWVEQVGGDGLLPSEIFTCKSLVVLKLRGKLFLEVPTLVSLPNLRVFHLDYLTVFGDGNGWKFSKGYPLLEELHISMIVLCRVRYINVSILNLTRLVVFGYHRVVINSPNLQYLKYSGSATSYFSVCKLSSLIKADLSLRLSGRFISQMYNVKSLVLHGGPLEDISQSTSWLPKFQNLTCMEISPSSYNQWQLLGILFGRTPNLEVLVCNLETSKGTGSGLYYGAIKIEPQCMALHLREVQIRNFHGYDFEFELARYILQNGVLLETLSIGGSDDVKREEWPSPDCTKLLKFKRCSENCKIEFT